MGWWLCIGCWLVVGLDRAVSLIQAKEDFTDGSGTNALAHRHNPYARLTSGSDKPDRLAPNHRCEGPLLSLSRPTRGTTAIASSVSATTFTAKPLAEAVGATLPPPPLALSCQCCL